MECLASVRDAAEGLDVGIVVLDNASDEDYEPALADWVGPSFEYIRRACGISGAANVAAGLELIRRSPYGIVFHDDDLMSPGLIAHELRALEENPELVFVAAEMSWFRDGAVPAMPDGEAMSCRTYGSESELALALLEGLPLHFGSVMYRTADLAGVKPDPARYGAVCDRPFLLDLARRGPCAVVSGSPSFYRGHVSQDSQRSVLPEAHWLALGESFIRCLGADAPPAEMRRYRRAASVYLLEVLAWTQRDGRHTARSLISEAQRRGLMGTMPLSLEAVENRLRAGRLRWVTYLWHPSVLASRLGFRRPAWMRRITGRR